MSNPTPQPFLPDKSGRWSMFPRDQNWAQGPRTSPRRHLLDLITNLSATERPPFDSKSAPTKTIERGPCSSSGAASGGPFSSCGLGNLGDEVTDPSPIESDVEENARLAARKLPFWLDPDNPCFGLDPYKLVRFMAGMPARVEPAEPYGPDSTEVERPREDIEIAADLPGSFPGEEKDSTRQADLQMFPKSPPDSKPTPPSGNEKNCDELESTLEDYEATLEAANKPPSPSPMGPPAPPKDPLKCDRITKIWERDCNKSDIDDNQKRICYDIVRDAGVRHCNDPNFGPRPWKTEDEARTEAFKERMKERIEDIRNKIRKKCPPKSGGPGGGGSQIEPDDETMALCVADLISSLLGCLTPSSGTTVSCIRQRPVVSCPPGEECGPLTCSCSSPSGTSSSGVVAEFENGNCPPECAAAKVAELQGDLDCSGCKGSASWMSLVELCATTSSADIFNSAGCGVIDPIPFFEIDTNSTISLPKIAQGIAPFSNQGQQFTSFASSNDGWV